MSKEPVDNEKRRGKNGRFGCRTELLPIQYEMIAELVSGSTKVAACEKLGVPRPTLYKWIDNDIFMDEYRKACERMYKMALGRAMDKLQKLMESKDGRTALKATENMLKLNSYLNPKVDVTENTTETITIRLLDDEEQAENEEE